MAFVAPCVYQAVRPLAQAEYKDAEFTPLSLFNFFINRCRENLHIVLAMSPIGDAFRNRLRQFPSLINCCTIDWFQVSINVIVYGNTKFVLPCTLGMARRCIGAGG